MSVALARIALRSHGGVMQDENGCACEHCKALCGLIEQNAKMSAALEDVALVAGGGAAVRIRNFLAALA